jgi:uncharacterized protein YjdB
MKKSFFLMLLLCFWGATRMNAQVGIGSMDGPREGAILDLNATNMGLLLPQVTLTDIGIYLTGATPIDGMLIFNMNDAVGEGKGVYVWDNTKKQWVFNGYRAGPVVVPVTGVTISSEINVILSGGTIQFTATVSPAGATNKAVFWEVAPGTGTGTIDANGLFTAEAPGSVQIRAKSAENAAIAGSKNITVTVPSYPVTAITVQAVGDATTMVTGATLQLSARVEPSNADNKTLTWESNNTTLATVNAASGLVTAKVQGNVRITAKATDGSGVSGWYDLLVTPVLVTGFTITPSAPTIRYNQDVVLTAGSFTPSNAALKEVNWELLQAPEGTYEVDIETTGTTFTIRGGTTDGTAIVKATAKDLGQVPRTLAIDVDEPDPLYVSGITLAGVTCVRNDDAIRVYAYSIAPYAATNKALSWSVTGGGRIIEHDDEWCRIVADGSGGAITVTATAMDDNHKTNTYATYGAVGNDREGEVLNDGAWDYTTWEFPNGIGTWMTKNSKFGTPTYTTRLDNGTSGEGYWYNKVDALTACPEGWALPAREDAVRLNTFVNSTCGNGLWDQRRWWGVGRVGGACALLIYENPAALFMRIGDEYAIYYADRTGPIEGTFEYMGLSVRCVKLRQ